MLTSCASYDQFKKITQGLDLPYKVFRYPYSHVWAAVKDVVISFNYDQEYINPDTGVIRSKWMENTIELNFSDSFGDSDSVRQARFKLVINVIKGYSVGREVSKVVIYKRQYVKNDFLQGWKEILTDGILEETILYRIERTLLYNKKLKEIQDASKNQAPLDF